MAKKILFGNWLLILLSFLFLSGQLYLSSQFIVFSRQVSANFSQSDKLEKENLRLQVQIAKSKSLQMIEIKASRFGMVPIKSVLHFASVKRLAQYP